MQLTRLIIIFFLLAPTQLFCQSWNQELSSRFQNVLDSVAREIFKLGVNNEITPYIGANFSQKLTETRLREITKDEKVTIQIQDSDYPNDEFALIDTQVILKFDLKQIRSLGFCTDRKGLLVIVPMRYDTYTRLWRPMFLVYWKEIENLLSKKEIALINYLYTNLEKEYFPVKWKSFEEGDSSLYYKHYTLAIYTIEEELKMGFEQLSKKNNLTNNPILFKDSLCEVPHGNFKLDSFDSTGLRLEKVFSDFSRVRLRYYSVSMSQKLNCIQIKLERVFQEYGKFGEQGVEILLTDYFFCKEDDVSSNLPEWLQFFMKEW